MDVFYEESAVAGNAAKAEKKYKIINIVSYVLLVIWILLLFFTVQWIPMPGVKGEKYQEVLSMFLFFLWNTASVFFVWFFLIKWKKRINVSYDYVFVTGELRIAKVFNVNKRKLATRFDCAEILQIGDVDNSSFERLKSDPTTKTQIFTSNAIPADGKFFMYVLINDNGKKLYVLECREELLIHILKFAQRSALESDYVMQEKKKKV